MGEDRPYDPERYGAHQCAKYCLARLARATTRPVVGVGRVVHVAVAVAGHRVARHAAPGDGEFEGSDPAGGADRLEPIIIVTALFPFVRRPRVPQNVALWLVPRIATINPIGGRRPQSHAHHMRAPRPEVSRSDDRADSGHQPEPTS
jgi:hypothetical protein